MSLESLNTNTLFVTMNFFVYLQCYQMLIGFPSFATHSAPPTETLLMRFTVELSFCLVVWRIKGSLLHLRTVENYLLQQCADPSIDQRQRLSYDQTGSNRPRHQHSFRDLWSDSES